MSWASEHTGGFHEVGATERPPARTWTNSVMARVVCTAFGVFLVALSFTSTGSAGEPWHGSNLLIDVLYVVIAVVVILMVWTSRLYVDDTTLTATRLFWVSSMPLAEVEDVRWSYLPFLGGRIRRSDGTGLRTLVSGKSWDELWKPRAGRIGEEILGRARRARLAEGR